MNDEEKEPDRKGFSVGNTLSFLTSEGLRKATAIVLVVLFAFYLPIPWIYREIQGVFHDHGVFYDAAKEGLIAIDSPQLFTRERLINQRLNDSAWIDGRIAVVDEMITEGRFGRPNQIRTQSTSTTVSSGGDASVETTPSGDTDEVKMNVDVSPLDEFSAAQEYRLNLVQQKFQSVLDDAHDTDSNTLQRLNFNMTILPGRNYSTSVAAVSIRLQQPEDPEWLLQKYGELLVDVREELQNTARRMIDDRMSIDRPDSNYALSSDIDHLLRTVLLNSAKRSVVDHNPYSAEAQVKMYVGQAQDRLRDDYVSLITGSFQAQLLNVATGTDIGPVLANYFFARPTQRPTQRPAPGQTLETKVQTASNQGQPGPPRQAPPKQPSQLDISLQRLEGSCLRTDNLVSVWSLLPVEFGTSKEYQRLVEEYSSNAAHFQVHEASENGDQTRPAARVGPEVGLRELLAQSTVRVTCPERPAKLAHKAMLQALGWLELPQNAKPVWAKGCFHPAGPSDDYFKNPLEKYRSCFELRRGLLKIGVVKLVHAELMTTPIDTVGRVRHLTDYFDISSDRCDLKTCEIVVRTISERQREAKLEAIGFDPLQHGRLSESQMKHIHADVDEIEKTALTTGRQEALRLFAELSCFANARSYMVYPRQGLGQNIARSDQRNWAMAWLLGENSVGSKSRVAMEDHERKNRVFGIGDSGLETDNGHLECGPSFLWILNNVSVEGDLIDRFETLLANPDSSPLDKVWLFNLACLLEIETQASKNGEKLAAQNQCREKAENYAKNKGSAFPQPENFNLNHVTSVVRFLRKKHTTISWVVQPEDMWLQGTRHSARSVPLSAIVSLPSWWPGVEIFAETCWLRPRNVNLQSGRSLCHETPGTQTSRTWYGARKTSRAGGLSQTTQILPLPYNLEDVLPKLGFFLVRYPYIDQFDPQLISVESGREVKLRLTGKRLWKNPMVRIGEQWHDKVEVLPDMLGIVATFKCLAPLSSPAKLQADVPGGGPISIWSKEGALVRPPVLNLGQSVSRNDARQDNELSEQRQVQVWTSEGKTGLVSITVRAFRPNFTHNGQFEPPCWTDQGITIRE